MRLVYVKTEGFHTFLQGYPRGKPRGIEYSKEEFTEVERKLRDRFMECLDYKTPRESFQIELQKQRKPLVRGMILEKLLVN